MKNWVHLCFYVGAAEEAGSRVQEKIRPEPAQAPQNYLNSEAQRHRRVGVES